MWSIKGVKEEAKQILKRNYLVLVFICSILLFLGILPGNGMSLTSVSETAVTEKKTEADEESYQPGLVRYLNSIIEGESKQQQMAIVEEVLNTSSGRGGAVYGIMRSVDMFFFANDSAAKILIVISMILYLIYWFIGGNLLLTGLIRITMDAGRPEHKVRFTDLFAMFRVDGCGNVIKVCFVWEICMDVQLIAALALLVWGATQFAGHGLTGLVALLLLAGVAVGIFFVYVYLTLDMVPYILATNPHAPIKESFLLSAAMAKGNRIKLLKLRLSYIGWDLLSIVTLGLVNLLYITPAINLAYGRVYMALRAKAIAEDLEYASLLEGEALEYAPTELKLNLFGRLTANRNPIRNYSIVNIVLMFFIFSFGGWCWEVLIHIVKDGLFINRGTMHGPWLPIYGFGGAGIVYFLNRFAKKPVLLTSSIFVGCGILEYVTHWYLEMTKGVKWWDYSNYFLNINGRICFEGLFVFCVAGVFAVYVAGPALDNLLNRVSEKKKWTIAGVLLAIFAADLAYSSKHPNVGKGITDYDKK